MNLRMTTPVRLFLVGVCVLFLVPQASWATKLVNAEARVEVTLPSSWTLGKVPGFSNDFGFGPVHNEFGTNVNIVAEKFAGTLPQYVKANMKSLKMVMKGFRLVSREDLKATSGIALTKLVSDTNMMQPLRQVFYLGKGQSGYYFVITCSVDPSASNQLEPIFEQIAQSVVYQ